MSTPTLPPLLAEQARIADETLTAVEDLLRTIDDAVGAVPPTAAEAADKVAALRRTMLTTMPLHTEELLAREISITTLGRRTVAGWLPVIVGHVVHHCDQLHDVLRSRGCLPARFDTAPAGGDA